MSNDRTVTVEDLEILNRIPGRKRGVYKPSHKGYPLGVIVGILIVLMMLTFICCLSIGSVHVPFVQVWQVVAHRLMPDHVTMNWSVATNRIVADVRLPRVILAALAGMTLASVGVVVQALLRNQLASPTILGVSSGAATGAIAVMRFGAIIGGVFALNIAAFLGALVTLVVVLMIARRGRTISASALVLTGMAISALLSALNNLMVLTSPDPQLASQVLFWSLGGFGGAKWELLPLPLIVLAAGMIYSLAQASWLNLLLGGEESAISLGLDIQRFRIKMFIVCAAMVGVCVAVCGVIGFVGLVIPHITRLLVGADHRRCLPISLLIGAIFMMGADLISRVIMEPQELPVGIVTAVIGAPFFLVLLHRSRQVDHG